LIRQLNTDNYFSYPRPRVQPQGARWAGTLVHSARGISILGSRLRGSGENHHNWKLTISNWRIDEYSVVPVNNHSISTILKQQRPGAFSWPLPQYFTATQVNFDSVASASGLRL